MKWPWAQESTGMKQFWSRHRQLSFELPANWRSRKERTGMIYCSPAKDRAALRLNVLCFLRASSDVPGPPMAAKAAEFGIEIEELGPHHWFFATHEQEQDEYGLFSFVTYYNMKCDTLATSIAVFTSSGHPPEVEAMLERQIREARFAE